MIRYLILMLVLSTTCFGQDSTNIDRVVARHAIKYSPFHLINFYPTIQLAYEFRIAKRFSIQIDGGLVVDDAQNTDYVDMRGFKVKLEPRYYLSSNLKGNFGVYSALELYYNRVDFDRKTIQEECFDFSCNHAFIQTHTFVVKYREPGFGFKIGFVKYISNFLIDINSGFATRFVEYRHPEYITDPLPERGLFRSKRREEDGIRAMPLLGIRIGYRIK